MARRKTSKRQTMQHLHRMDVVRNNTVIRDGATLLPIQSIRLMCWLHFDNDGGAIRPHRSRYTASLPSGKNMLRKTAGRRVCALLQGVDNSIRTTGKRASVASGRFWIDTSKKATTKRWSMK